MAPKISNEQHVRRVLTSALRRAKKQVEYADLLYEREVKVEVQQLADRLIAKPFNARSRVQLRLLNRGRKAEVKVGTLDPATLNRAIESGVKLLKASPKPERPIRLAPIPNPGKVRYGAPAPATFPADAIFDGLVRGITGLCRQAERRHAKRKLRVSPEFWFFTQREEKAIADTDGVFKTQVMPRSFLQLITRVRGRDGRMTQTRARLGNCRDYTEYLRRSKSGRFTLAPRNRKALAEWIERTIALQDAVTLTPAQVKKLDHLILHYTTAGVFVHEALGHNFEADIVKAGGSGIIDREGEPRGEVACEDVDILDGPVCGDFTDGFGTEYIDDEGVEVQDKLLARKGVVVGMIHDRETAAYYGEEPNGGAFSQLGDARLPRMSNTYIRPASMDNWRRDLQALIRDVKRGVVLIGTTGGAVSRDGMSSSVQLGWLVENGRITKTVKPANFSAKTLHALRHVDGFAGPLSIADVGFCGKGQTRYVGDGGPTWTRLKNNDFVGLSVQG